MCKVYHQKENNAINLKGPSISSLSIHFLDHIDAALYPIYKEDYIKVFGFSGNISWTCELQWFISERLVKCIAVQFVYGIPFLDVQHFRNWAHMHPLLHCTSMALSIEWLLCDMEDGTSFNWFKIIIYILLNLLTHWLNRPHIIVGAIMVWLAAQLNLARYCDLSCDRKYVTHDWKLFLLE